jgi:hypothetical protein
MNTPVGNRRRTCTNCIHYYITFDASFRYGCRALNFKSKRQPVLDVIESSGDECQFFLSKPFG